MSQAFIADARRLDGHTLRGAAVLFAAINIGPLYAIWAETWPGSPGLGLMIGLTNALWLVSSVFGCYVFARVISEERSQETYGLLLLTGLGPGAFLLAKSISRVVLILLAIGITIPFWFLCVTFGGVMPVQVIACALVLLANLIVVSQIGTLCAACFEGELRPVGSAIACALIYTLVPMATPSVRPLLGLGGLNVILQPGFNDLVGTLLWSLIATGIAVALFAIAWGVLSRRGPPERRREESPQEWKAWLSVAPEAR